MVKNDPFGFDMSVSASKKKNPRGRRGMTGASETSTRLCDHAGCQEKGAFRAPKSPDSLDDYWWFCKDHVREYNLKWNFFQGVTEQEFRDNALALSVEPLGGSPTGQNTGPVVASGPITGL